MPIRPDFQEVERPLNRLLVYGRKADEFNREDWPHLRNGEDFERVFRLDNEQRSAYEDLYGDGRDCAVWMAGILTGFNEADDFPTLRSYVAAFDNSWVFQITKLKEQVGRIVALRAQHGEQPWSVRQMAGLFQRQIDMLEATAVVLNELKQTKLYKREGGEADAPENESSGNSSDFLENILAFVLLLGVGLVGFSFLSPVAGIIWLVFAIAVPPLGIAYARGAQKMTGNHLTAIYKAGIGQIGVIFRPLKNLFSKK